MGCQSRGYKFSLTEVVMPSETMLQGGWPGSGKSPRRIAKHPEQSGLLPLTGFCGFLVLIEMEFRYARMSFRSYAQIKSFSGKGKGVGVMRNFQVSSGYYVFYYICLRWYYRTNEHIANTVKSLVTY